MKKNKLFLLIIGLILMVIPFFINFYSILRLLSYLVGFIIFIIGFLYNKKRNVLIFIVPLLGMFCLYFVDYFVTKTFNIVPIISVKKTSSSKVKTYDSIFYRVYDCDNNLYFDKNYKKNYLCNNDDISVININTFLENPSESYKKYKGTFVHLSGKINTITGNSSLTLNTYEDNNELNGYVEFTNDKKIKINNLKFDASNYHVYDNIEIIGLVKKIVVNEKNIYEITLIDAVIIDTHTYDKYEVLVNTNSTLELNQVAENLYYFGISGIYYRYTENDIYELDYLIEDKRESIDNLIKDAKETVTENYTLYETKEYNIVKCTNGNIIFANNNYHNIKSLCIK